MAVCCAAGLVGKWTGLGAAAGEAGRCGVGRGDVGVGGCRGSLVAASSSYFFRTFSRASRSLRISSPVFTPHGQCEGVVPRLPRACAFIQSRCSFVLLLRMNASAPSGRSLPATIDLSFHLLIASLSFVVCDTAVTVSSFARWSHLACHTALTPARIDFPNLLISSIASSGGRPASVTSSCRQSLVMQPRAALSTPPCCATRVFTFSHASCSLVARSTASSSPSESASSFSS